ncbi:hypothetical protein PPERSA_09742 [Pseudocohnilembus persalinus]|uniref:Uncharacterized protein n=1 Tax=Pseudocohnilembus persalinus TaxID=266149 RepID=A0A0V0Q8M6_PSEPJ|nr:hypothetical protein PPERSA_09742 [Pseudocohnilembus persalinus]|eukprot:KRW98589.1 hypothetical protein PPERSA_09742 [Pseudocohnilembus persalinus]
MLQLDDFQGRLGRPVRDPNLQDEPLDLETQNQADLYETALNYESENDESQKPDGLTQILELYNDRLKKNQEYLENELKNQNNQEFKQIFLQIVKREYQLLNNLNQNEDDLDNFGIKYRYLEMMRRFNSLLTITRK